MIYLLDTDTFTLAYHNRHGVRERIASRNLPDFVFVSIITKIEVLLGRLDAIKKAATAADILRMQDYLDQSEAYLSKFRSIAFLPLAGQLFDQFRTEKRRGRMDRGDLLIACIALAHDATLVTRNTKDFAPITGLKVENWAD
jgi:predicted nucleic acid-binding protein